MPRPHTSNRLCRCLAWSGAAALTAICAGASAGPVEDLEPGHWYEVPDSNMAPHMPPSTGDDWGGPGSIMGAWSGGAYDTARDRLIIWGGGHQDYAGNEIYVFDIATLAWERLNDRSADVGGDESSGYYPDGTPRSRHTYEYIEYLPPPFDKFCSLGGAALFPSGQIGISNVDCFDFGSLTWQRMADAASSGIGAVAAVDPNTGFAWIQGTGNSLPLAHFEPMADQWHTHVIEPSGWFGYSHTAAIDPGRQQFVAVGGGQTIVWDMAAPAQEPVVLQTTGATEIQDAGNPGLAYDMVSDKMVAWMGGADLYSLDLDASEWLRHPPAATNTVVPTDAAENGTYGRFRYVASRNVFVVVNAIDENVYVGKFEPGSGTGTGVGGTGGSGGGGTAGTGGAGGAGQGGSVLPSDGASDPSDDGGCGCRATAPARTAGGWPATLLFCGLWLARRRRSSAASSGPALLAAFIGATILGCDGDPEREPGPGVGGSGVLPPTGAEQIGSWDAAEQTFSSTFCVRPPGQSYGSGDGSSWDNAFADLPADLVRGAKYYLASGDYDEAEPTDHYTDYDFDDPDDGDQFIGIFKATTDDHGTDDGWDPSYAAGPARLGPLAFETGHYIIDGQEGEGDQGHGIAVAVDPGACPSSHTLTLFFTWNAQSSYIGLHHLDISSCGGVGDPTTPAQDSIYGYHTDDSDVSHVTLKHVYVHDTKRVHAFLLGWDDVLIEDCLFARSGQHHESSSLAMRDASNVVVRRNVFQDAINVYVSLQSVRHVHIYSNVFVGTLAGWDIWNSIHSSQPLIDVFIYGNTFYNLTGLSTGLRFSDNVTNLRVFNNIWAHNRTNQIPMAGEHDYNAFWDNWRIDTDPHQDLNDNVDEEHAQILDADPFVDGAAGNFHLSTATESGSELPAPYDRDGDDAPRGADGVWDRGAYEFAQ